MSLLITGGTGSFGRAMTARLLASSWCRRIVIYSRGEHAQADMARQFAAHPNSGRLRFFIGDVRDRDRLKRAMYGVQYVIHAAALKRIEVGAYNPIEMVKTNIGGAINVIEACQDCDVGTVVALSTDKAWQPISPYGQSKALAESLFLNCPQDRTKFAVCRYGNVWGSAGSVVPTWRAAIAAGGPIRLSDPDVTRFFMLMDEALDLVLDTLNKTPGKQLVIPELPAYRLGDLLEAVLDGADKGRIPIELTGLPAWEKMHEGMSDGMTSDIARRMTIAELRGHL